MDFSMGDKTLVKHFLSLTETFLTTKQARQAADFLKELVMSDFLEALEKCLLVFAIVFFITKSLVIFTN